MERDEGQEVDYGVNPFSEKSFDEIREEEKSRLADTLTAHQIRLYKVLYAMVIITAGVGLLLVIILGITEINEIIIKPILKIFQ